MSSFFQRYSRWRAVRASKIGSAFRDACRQVNPDASPSLWILAAPPVFYRQDGSGRNIVSRKRLRTGVVRRVPRMVHRRLNVAIGMTVYSCRAGLVEAKLLVGRHVHG